VSTSAFLKDDRSWKLLCHLYETHGIPGMSFPDYFWTWRATHLPLFRVLESPLSDADLIHTISTGYAGCVAAVHKLQRGIPMITTEHGLYTRERAQEIWDADWIPGEDRADERRASNAFKTWWNRMFEGMERITYATSDAVISLFEENRRYQISRGASEDRASVIPNGVDLSFFDGVRASRRATGRFHIGLVGRIVPIKDIKTFIAACGILRDQLGADLLEASLIGPRDEDEIYASQCVEMVRLLGLEKVVRFLGKRDPREYYRTLDSLVLTSLSEGQPLVLLEGMACGIPFVATDVGCCRELLEGRDGEDRKLGTAGLITRIAAPEETAAALYQLAGNPDLRERMARAGRRRVETYYRLDQVRTAYLDLYRRLTDGRR
jgi:glycosyltransferase involved in cell wall biosynthesis